MLYLSNFSFHRWHRNKQGEIVKIDGLPVLEFVAIFRPSFNEWAIPG